MPHSPRRIFLGILFIIFFQGLPNVWAQVAPLSGIVKDPSGQSLPGAGVTAYSETDSSLVASSVTDSSGVFRFTLSPGNYFLKFSFISFSDFYRVIEMSDKPVNLGSVVMQVKSTSLKAINVDAEVLHAQQKGDTTQYNADAYKVNKDATAEDLATKMPGITLQDGKVQAQGEDVKRVLVDGKPYLGDDPNAALKNLPAEMIDKIQVYDRKSDQSAFTGFDDGNSSKTLNIITRPQFRNGTFGRVYSGYGTEELWKNGMNINFFKDKRKLTILGNANKINEQNFSTDDLLGVIGTNAGNRQQGSHGGYGGRGGGSGGGRPMQNNDAGAFLVDAKNGIATTYSTGINYANQWKKFGFSFSYFYNRSENNATTNLFRQYFSNTEGLNYVENNSAKTTSTNHRANLSLDYKIDSLNSVLLQPRITFQKSNGSSNNYGVNSNNTGILSRITNGYTSSGDGINFSSPILYRRSFIKKGRTLSLNLTPGYSNTENSSGLISTTTTIFAADSVIADQVSEIDASGKTLSSEVVYTEPVSEEGQISFTYKNYYNYGNSDKRTFTFSPTDEIYNQIDSSTSNKFNSTYFSQSAGTSYRYQKTKWNAMAGFAYQLAKLSNEQFFPLENKIAKEFRSILPNAMFQYKFTSSKNLRIFYRTSNNSPSVSQLQDVINNNNPLQLSKGNPALKQDWQNNINIRFSSVNTAKNTSFFIYTGATITKDYIGNSTFISSNDTSIVDGIVLTNGTQLSKPVNLEGYFSIRLFGNYSFPLKKIKSTLNLNANGNYSNTPSIINLVKNESKTINGGMGFSLSSNISDKLDFTVSSNGSLSSVRNTNQTTSNNDYFNLNSRFKIQFIPWKGLVLQTDLSYQYNTGLSGSYNQNYLLWNGGIGYKFLKNRVAELRLTVFDILEKNTNITRNTTDTYYEDIQSNQLQRYFMLTFTYNLKFFKVDKKEPEK